MLAWLEKLTSHFGASQDEEQIEIFLHALRNSTIYQVDIAFDRCLNECQFMPKLADIHAKMPEQRYAPENPAGFVLNGPPVLDLVREVAREICPEYNSLDATNPEQRKKIYDVCFAANRLRYERMGIDCSRWGKA